jgi:sugar phosphate isomerase/epimerase
MSETMIGAQMYTLRDHTQTLKDFAATCRRLREMGYGAVQLSAVGKDIAVTDLAKALRDEGLVCAATHVGMDMMQDASACADYHQTLGCKLTAVGGAGLLSGADAWKQFCRDYNAAAKGLAESGITIGYHNHSHELAPVDGYPAGEGSTIMDLLIRELDTTVWFEVDTYWIAHGGGDPAAWLDKIAASGPNRLPAIHVKDMAITPDREQLMCEIGLGNLNWPAILASAKRAGVRWFLVERDRGELDPFDSLRRSLEGLRSMGLA